MIRALMVAAALCLVSVWSATALAQAAHTLTLAQALETARAHAPELRKARASIETARAHVDVTTAPLLPQVSGNASYERGTANSSSAALGASHSDFATFDNWNFSLRATQLIYDFGQTTGVRSAAKASVVAQAESERTTLASIELSVRLAYFGAAAQKQLLAVARDTLANQERHRAQIEAFVEVGTRPAIDLAQIKTDLANAKLGVIRAENAYAIGKAELARTMGTPGSADFETGDELLPAVDGEDAPLPRLVEQARNARPELAAFAAQVHAQELSITAIEGAYGPNLSVGTGISDAGRKLDDLAWNWSAGLTLSWPIFQGGLTTARAREARATLNGLRAQLEIFESDMRVALQEARLNVQGARAAVVAADEVVNNAKERRELAEARYNAGAGNIIELADAELALRNAQVERARADFDLASARAQLLQALGR